MADADVAAARQCCGYGVGIAQVLGVDGMGSKDLVQDMATGVNRCN